MTNRKIAWLSAAVTGVIIATVAAASSDTVRGPAATGRLYDRLVPAYDLAAWIVRPLGARRLQERAIDLLDLHPGDTVVDLGCGTGVNFQPLADAVGDTGRIIGVDLSAAMLDKPRLRAERHHLTQVTLEQADIRDVQLRAGTTAVIATGALEMVPEYDAVVARLARHLGPPAGRLAVGGLRRLPGWPAWAIALGRAATAPFGVTRAYEAIQPWRSVQHHMDTIAFETAAGGAIYLIVAQPAPTSISHFEQVAAS